ncbi:MAG: sensor histidine kinase, partial [Candidatus Sumerlaeota bacterium]
MAQRQYDPDNVRYIKISNEQDWDTRFSSKEREVLRKINLRVTAEPSLEGIMDFLFDETCNMMPCDRIGLAFLEENQRRVTSHLVRALYEPIHLKKGYTQDIRDSSLEPILAGNEIRIIRDLQHYSAENPDSVSTRLILREGVRSSMTCPLVVDGRQVGFFFRSSRHVNAYQDHDVDLFAAVAHRLSQAVEKAHIIELLQEANQAYTEMLGFVAHELKSPIASMVMDADILNTGYLGQLEPAQKKKIEGMMHKGKYLLGLISDYLNLAKMEQSDFEPEFEKGVDFRNEIIERTLDMLKPQLHKKKMVVCDEVDCELPLLECDPNLMQVVMTNLTSNAIKYGKEGGHIIIRGHYGDDRLRVSVWNEGPGFGESARSSLFRRFSRLKDPELKKEKGTGLGLYNTWRIIQAHGGRIAADSEKGK